MVVAKKEVTSGDVEQNGAEEEKEEETEGEE